MLMPTLEDKHSAELCVILTFLSAHKNKAEYINLSQRGCGNLSGSSPLDFVLVTFGILLPLQEQRLSHNLHISYSTIGVLIMTEYYFDMETTGFDCDVDEIITIQWQELKRSTGEPIGELNILKRWESSEKHILETFVPNLRGRPFDFIAVGDNLMFDFCFLGQRMKRHNLGELGLRYLHDTPSVNLKPVLVLINEGNFKGYTSVIPKTNPIENKEISQLFKEYRYSEIIRYIKDEAEDFLGVYRILKRKMPLLKEQISHRS